MPNHLPNGLSAVEDELILANIPEEIREEALEDLNADAEDLNEAITEEANPQRQTNSGYKNELPMMRLNAKKLNVYSAIRCLESTQPLLWPLKKLQ